MNWLLFISAFWTISLLPGLNMTLAMSVGMGLGYKKSLWLTLSISIVTIIVAAICAVFGGIILSSSPLILRGFTIVCALYLLYVAYKMFKNSKFELDRKIEHVSAKMLIFQGFMCAISNPKAWAFFVALIPPFLDVNNPFGSRFYEILIVMFVIEFIDLNAYALGGVAFKKLLAQKAYILEKISAVLVVIIAILMISDKF